MLPAPQPDLERGDYASLQVPRNLYAQPTSSPKPTPTPNDTRTGAPRANGVGNPRSRSLSRRPRRQSQHPPPPPSHIHRPQQQQQQQQQPPHKNDPTAIPPKLLKFRTLIGISTPASLSSSSSSSPTAGRPAPNVGIYARIIAEERNARAQFYFAASIINTCYFGQIIVAAALTALGASGASDVAVTVLGATNTVIAGILTYLKGQGLPNRLRMYWNGLRKCREFIEEKERECEAEGWRDGDEGEGEGGGFEVDEVVEVVVRMYHDVRQTAEDNTPDTYLPTQGGKSSSSAAAAAPLLAREKNLGGNSIRYPDEDGDYRSESEGEAEAEGEDKAKDDAQAENTKPPSQPAPTTTAEEAPATRKHISSSSSS